MNLDPILPILILGLVLITFSWRLFGIKIRNLFSNWRPGIKGGQWIKTNIETGESTPIKFSDSCWDCGHKNFRQGPSGGLCTNVECVSCGARYNSNPIEGLFQRIDGR